MSGMAREIKNALQRIAVLGASAGPGHAHLMTGQRRAILDVVRDSPTPMTIDQITAQTTVHPNTTRHHLDVLAAAKLVERSSALPTGRGRPQFVPPPTWMTPWMRQSTL